MLQNLRALILIQLIFNQFSLVTAQTFVSTFFGTGAASSVDGDISQASFNNPYGIKFDADDNLIVADTSNKIRKVFPNGTVITIAGSGAATSTDGQGTLSTIYGPTGVDVDAAGNVFAVEQGGCKIRKISLSGYMSTVAGSGSCASSADGLGAAASFKTPWGVTLDANNNLWVAESFGFYVRKIAPDGMVTKFSGSGASGLTDGPATSATFVMPSAIAIDRNGDLIVADGTKNAYLYAGIRRVYPNGTVKTIAGGPIGYAVGPGSSSRFNYPLIPIIAENGDIFVADFINAVVLRINASNHVSVFVGTPPAGSPAGPFSSITLNYPVGIAFDKYGSFFVTEGGTRKIRKITCTTACTPGTVAQTLNGCVCTPCPISTYQPQSGQTLCFSCPNNTICTDTGMAKFLCSPGLQENGTSCTQCPSGTFKSGTTGSCLNCPAGATCNRTSFTCNAGFGLNVTGNGCVACGGASYKSIASNDGCWSCPSNAICTATSFTCLPGFQSNGTACTECSSGAFKAGTTGSCLSCPAGATCNRTSFACNAGFGLNVTGNGCVACGGASYKSIASNDACWPCPSNAICSATSFTCSAGYTLSENGQTCTLAPSPSAVSQPTTSSSSKITVTSTPTTKNNQQVDSLNTWATWWKSYTSTMISIFVSVWLLMIAIGFVVGYYTGHHASPKSTPYDNMTKTTTTKISELAGTGMYRPRSGQRTIRSTHAARTLRSRPQSQHGETSFSAP